MNRVLVDTNVALDRILKREGVYDDAMEFFTTARKNGVSIYLSSKSVVDIYYWMRRAGISAENAKEVLKTFLGLVYIANIVREDCLWALDSPVKDYEDAVQIECAYRNKMDAIITQNAKDFQETNIPVYTPAEFCEV